MTVPESKGSVLDDLFEPEEAADLKLKAALARRIRDVMEQRKLTQKQAAALTETAIRGMVGAGATNPKEASTTEEVRVWGVEAGYDWEETTAPECEWQTQEMSVWHSERTWWLLAPNPFVVVADAQPLQGDVESLANELFLLQTCGDDRAVVETYVAGRPMKSGLN